MSGNLSTLDEGGGEAINKANLLTTYGWSFYGKKVLVLDRDRDADLSSLRNEER